jgi:hypothetical protein
MSSGEKMTLEISCIVSAVILSSRPIWPISTTPKGLSLEKVISTKVPVNRMARRVEWNEGKHATVAKVSTWWRCGEVQELLSVGLM